MNNRQAGRRRGRGGQRSQGGGPNNRPDNGNRIDSRARGNAAQLLEKYKNLARDSQMQGDRVNTEYYLQFADHYFRVLGESRARFEENNGRRQQHDEDEDDFDMEGEPGTPDQVHYDRRPERSEPRAERNDRGDRPERAERRDRDDRRRERTNGHAGDAEAPQPAPAAAESAGDAAPADEAPRRRGRPRRQPVAEAGEVSAAQPSIDADRLPPSLGLVSEPEVEDAPKPRRRRKVRGEDEEAATTAA